MTNQKRKPAMYKVHVSYNTVSKALTKVQATALAREIKRKTKKATVNVRSA